MCFKTCAHTDPSQCNSTNSLNPQILQNCHNHGKHSVEVAGPYLLRFGSKKGRGLGHVPNSYGSGVTVFEDIFIKDDLVNKSLNTTLFVEQPLATPGSAKNLSEVSQLKLKNSKCDNSKSDNSKCEEKNSNTQITT